MAQRAVLLETPRAEADELPARRRWMRYFFTDDTSPDNRAVVDLQRRAVWIGIALVLQSLDEIDHHWYIPYLMPFGSLIPLALIVGSMVAIWMAFRPSKRKQQRQQFAEHPRRWQRIALILILLTSIAGGIEFGRGIVMCFLPPEFSNDGTTLDTNAAALLLQGRNPYTDSNFISLARQFPFEPTWTTPLRVGQFANRLDYPSDTEFQTVLDTALKTGQAPEFESKVSYPALSFLTLVPFVLLHPDLHTINVLPFYLLSYLLLVVIAWKVTRPELRPWVLLLALANVPMWSSTVGGNLDVFCILLVVIAWLLRGRRWSSAIFLGLAVATKQPAWFFVPFYGIMVWRQQGLREALGRLSIAGAVALAINLPFIIWNPQAFLAGVLAPMADPMFPMGVGIINLSVTHLIPYLPERAYTVLEAIAMLGMLVWYWRICRRHPEAALLFAIVPLLFAWRSLQSYFYCAAFPLFILLVARRRRGLERVSGRLPRLPLPFVPKESKEREERRLAPAPIPVASTVALRRASNI